MATFTAHVPVNMEFEVFVGTGGVFTVNSTKTAITIEWGGGFRTVYRGTNLGSNAGVITKVQDYQGSTLRWELTDISLTRLQLNTLRNSDDGTGIFVTDYFSGDDTVVGSDGDDTLVGYDGDDIIAGGLGNDILDGDTNVQIEGTLDIADYRDAGAAVVVNLATGVATGGAGTDQLFHFEGIYGSSFNDTLTGDENDNQLFGFGGADTLKGASGADLLDGGTGGDTMEGGRGRDTYIVDSTTDVVQGEISSVSGTEFDTVTASVNHTLADNVEKLVLIGAATLGTGNADSNEIVGNGNVNTLKGNDGNDMLDGAGGDDTLDGGNGDDTLNGGAGGDSMKGGADNDTYEVNASGDAVRESNGGGDDTVNSSLTSHTVANYVERLVLIGAAKNGTGNTLDNEIVGNGGNNILDGGTAGDDVLSGADGIDTLNGGTGADTLDGGNGNDTLNGGSGDDAMNGGKGADAYLVDSTRDVVVETTVSRSASELDTVSSSVTYTLRDNVERLFLTGTAANGTGNAGNNEIDGNSSINRLLGADGDDMLDGLGGNDTLDGGDDDDTLVGGSGNDALKGGNGSDEIYGGAGLDTLIGGAGRDFFVYEDFRESGVGATRRDVITFSTADDDRINLSAIDANRSTSANEAFAWVNRRALDAEFTDVAGQLRFAGGILQGDLNGDGRADFEIQIKGALVISDIIL